ncbi:hypothetical protein FFF34_014135 [Inquilinus sp. KBS0705]|nr:hypothetical protein FFF34_014135 [Inquilinus sp. KBS0705]
MIQSLPSLKTIAFAALFMFAAIASSHAQDKTKRIGNKPRTGSSNSSFDVVKGDQVAIKMDAGNKQVQLLQFSFDVTNNYRDSIPFKVNVYEYNEISVGDNYVKQDIISYIPKGKNKITVDLAPYNIALKKNILVSIEWLQTIQGADPSFAIGLFNGGTYRQESGRWKKTPVAGVDFNVIIKKVK